MHPILFHIGGINIYSYGVLVATGVLAGLWWARQDAPRAGLDPDKIWNMGSYTVLVALLLAKVWVILSDWDYYVANPRDIFSLNTFQSGGTFYGGIVGAILMIVLYSYFQKMPLLPVMDTIVAGVPLGHGIGRLGCFAAGCCYGKPTSVAWGVVFTNPAAEQLAGTPLGVHLHPTQLYEAAAEFLNFLILVWIGKRQRFTGQIIATYFLLYGLERGTIEFLRGATSSTMMFHAPVSLMQIVSIRLIVTGALLWWRAERGKSASLASASAPRATVAKKMLLASGL